MKKTYSGFQFGVAAEMGEISTGGGRVCFARARPVPHLWKSPPSSRVSEHSKPQSRFRSLHGNENGSNAWERFLAASQNVSEREGTAAHESRPEMFPKKSGPSSPLHFFMVKLFVEAFGLERSQKRHQRCSGRGAELVEAGG